jgi:uroporphyrinogen decarboxylase
MMIKPKKPMLEILNGRKPERVPFWMMRQAGRYLAEYMALRERRGSFLSLLYHPESAAEVTVQPLRRFGMDAAILFSDILVVPQALGLKLSFEQGGGPRLEKIESEADLSKLSLKKIDETLFPIYETVALACEKLSAEGFDKAALIGFCGSPWTVACYMLEGGSSKAFETARSFAYANPGAFQKLIDILVESSCQYLAGQIRAGAEIIQLFESWAGLPDTQSFADWVIAPNARITKFLKENFPEIPVIGFPRGCSAFMEDYARGAGVDALSLDHGVSPFWAASNIPPGVVLQGNLDPMRLLVGGESLRDGMEYIHTGFEGRPFIFNLGHGISKDTPLENVMLLRDTVRGWTP